jgi:hypothetical protein
MWNYPFKLSLPHPTFGRQVSRPYRALVLDVVEAASSSSASLLQLLLSKSLYLLLHLVEFKLMRYYYLAVEMVLFLIK